MVRILRVFPRKTVATPDDDLVRLGEPDILDLMSDEYDEVHISVTFTYDKRRAEYLAKQWEMSGRPVKVGGPAYDDRMGDFTPGLYIRKGDTFEKAERRLTDTLRAGFIPYAMLYRDKDGKVDPEWRRFQREWCRPIIVAKKANEIWKEDRCDGVCGAN